MKFQKGKSGNPTGRKPGSRNKNSEAIRQQLKQIIEDNMKSIKTDFRTLKAAERFRVLDGLLKYVLPPPITLERLSEDQLKQLHEYLLKRYDHEQSGESGQD